MLTVHHSNRLELLADRLAERLREPCGGPLLPEIIVVQSNGMARWLSLHLAQRLGICARIWFPFPAAFVWELCRRLLSNVPETSPFAPDVLAWRIMTLLETVEERPCFAPLHAYCADGHDSTRFALAVRIADLFDQYLLYRPDWITRWERGEEEHWQAELWRRLATGTLAHRVRLHERLLPALQTERLAQVGLPGRISLIGIPTMPPLYLDVFARLAACIDVQWLLLDPYQTAYEATLADQESTRHVPMGDAEALSSVTGNRLLASMSRLGQDFMGLVHAHQPQMIAQFAEPGAATLLHCLQSDILHGRNRGTAAWPATPLRADDCSVQVHICHSRMREVEVLYDQLVRLFEVSPTLHPADVLVMTPDIEAYAPLIEAAFTARTHDRSLPFSIADRSPRAERPLVNGFFALLDLPGSRYTVNQLVTLLELTAVQRRFGFDTRDLPLVSRWLHATGVRWGIDHDSRAALGLPAIREHTWRAGLDRLLLGYALPGEPGRFFADLLPYEAVEGAEAQVLGHLHTFTDAAFQLATMLRAARSVDQWVTILSGVVEQFFLPDETEELDVQALRSALQHLGQTATQAGFEPSVSLDVITTWLRRSLETSEWSTRFLTGGITCCAMVPMRSLPFKVVCLLGMSDGQFPRLHRSLSFDRMAEAPRPGDRSRRDEDRYLFLEALLSARHCLYLSYVGRDIRDHSALPPSVLVSELVEAITRGFYPMGQPGGAIVPQVVTHHPLQAFSRRYFTGNPKLFSYAADLCEASRVAGRTVQQPGPLVTAGLRAPGAEWRTVEVHQFLAFFGQPTRFFVHQRLGIFLEEDAGALETREPFTLEPLARYALRQEALKWHLHGESPERIHTLLRAAGLLPHGQVGTTLFECEWPGIARFAQRLQHVLPAATRCTLDVDLHVGAWHLTGQLTNVMPHGLVGSRLGRIRPQDYLTLWILHLLLNCLAPANVQHESRWVGEDDELLLCAVQDPQRHLHGLLEWYWHGLHRPLHFFPTSAFAYTEATRAGKPDPLREGRTKWEGSEFSRGECEDRYYQLAFRGTDPLDDKFVEVADAVFLPLFAHL